MAAVSFVFVITDDLNSQLPLLPFDVSLTGVDTDWLNI